MLNNQNLAYLTWLSKQSRAYWIITGILVFLLGINVYDYWRSENRQAVGENTIQSDDALVRVDEEVQKSVAVEIPMTNNQEKEEELQEEVPQEIIPVLPEEEYVDPLTLSAYRSPCHGKIICSFGVCFDERYGDYRYHQGLVYQPSEREITASLPGIIVKQYSENDQQVLVIDEGTYQLIYSGLEEVFVAVGEQVVAGQIVAATEKLLTVEALRCS